ncbi:MAG: S8 family serine peptidase [Candidatus Saelkia tenebricola]|nr:S8 family serine peptidase [Candidatus Saelkia tenebricola]
MKMKKMKIIGVFSFLTILLGLGLFSQLRGGRDTGPVQVVDEFSSASSIADIGQAFEVEEFQEKEVIVASKPEVKEESYVFSSSDMSRDPKYINDLRYSGIEVKEHKENTELSEAVSKYYQNEGYPKLEKKITKKLPENSIPGELIVQSLDWQDDGTYKVGYRFVKITPGEEIDAIDIISDDPNVIGIEPNMTIRIQAADTIGIGLPGDIGSGTEIEEVLDPYFDRQWALKKIEADQVWGMIEEGEDVNIVIMDTGIDLEHPDLVDNVDLDYSCDYMNNDDEPEDVNGHGTHVAGIIAAISNDIGVRGVMPRRANLIIQKILNEGTGSIDVNSLASAIVVAASEARVVNMSWVTEIDMMAASDILRIAFRVAFDSDALLVAGAGNNGEVLYPAKYDEVLAVGGTDRDDKRWVTADFESAYGDEIAVSAPAKDVFSTLIGEDYDSENDGYGVLEGTSMSTAFVTGVVGLLLSKNPDLTKQELIDLITDEENVDEIDYGDEDSEEYKLGVGRINAKKALEAVGGRNTDPIIEKINYQPQHPVVGDEIAFTADVTLSDSAERIVSYMWGFDDIGVDSQGSNGAPFTYQDAGIHTVSLMVTDDIGNTATKIIEVTVVGVLGNEIWIMGVVTENDTPKEGVEVEISYVSIPLPLESSRSSAISVISDITDTDGKYKIIITGVEENDVYEIKGRMGSSKTWDLIESAATAGNTYIKDFAIDSDNPDPECDDDNDCSGDLTCNAWGECVEPTPDPDPDPDTDECGPSRPCPSPYECRSGNCMLPLCGTNEIYCPGTGSGKGCVDYSSCLDPSDPNYPDCSNPCD